MGARDPSGATLTYDYVMGSTDAKDVSILKKYRQLVAACLCYSHPICTRGIPPTVLRETSKRNESRCFTAACTTPKVEGCTDSCRRDSTCSGSMMFSLYLEVSSPCRRKGSVMLTSSLEFEAFSIFVTTYQRRPVWTARYLLGQFDRRACSSDGDSFGRVYGV